MKFILASLLLCCSALIMAYAMDDIAVIKAESERTIAILRCESETLGRMYEERILREQFKHAIELRNLDAAIQKQSFENFLRLMEERDDRSEPRGSMRRSEPRTANQEPRT